MPVKVAASSSSRKTSARRHATRVRVPELARDALAALRRGTMLEGRVRTDAGNRLVYETTGGRTLTLDGTWRLTASDDLVFTVRGIDGLGPRTLRLAGGLERVGAHQLVFALEHGEGRTGPRQHLTLTGRWQADGRNRLRFLVDKADGPPDTLTLQGAWEVGPDHALRYRTVRPRRGRAEPAVRFDGAWDFSRRGRLVYRLDAEGDSAFEFRAALESPTLRAAAGRMVYQIGAGVGRSRLVPRRITLYGRWNLSARTGVSFEIPLAGGRRQTMRFIGTVRATPRHDLDAALESGAGAPLGLTVTFSRRWLQDRRWFIQVRRTPEETAAMAGVQLHF